MMNVSLLSCQKSEELMSPTPSQNMHCICPLGCAWVIADLWCSGKKNAAMPPVTLSDMVSLPADFLATHTRNSTCYFTRPVGGSVTVEPGGVRGHIALTGET
eukprot:6694999-Ditylum_brightwellii.AAC.1